ncbi:hypothetical protein C8Q76DRAFT_792320 [Earliella scabrosa]|nr:hypothetical protein C8Q76DRAFT_792320 [Earliella scabrosa]
MSDQTEITSIIAEYSSLVDGNYCAFAALALLLYEYLITFHEEKKLFWRRKWSGASVLFFMNRYAPLLYNILNNVNFWVHSKTGGVTFGIRVSNG